MNDPTTPYSTAKGYVQSAFVMMTSPMRFQVPDDSSFYLSFHMLTGFATELYLKSFLASQGYTEKDLRRPEVRHDLRKLLEMAEAKGLNDSGATVLVDLLGDHHKSYEFRYMRADSKYSAIHIRHVFDALSSLDRTVDKTVGASAAHGKQPGHGWHFYDDLRRGWRFS
ncbi:hypothetical protein [Mesorhizobium sp. ES1-3]|uniref:hypothetical protein n=1 Tax=Mesorhizobium sp. ES1-3 TaxID=2876628 RepID=UPI001CCAD8E8|nr:hypothetical protein [Mesorhizobium sp. ES1-3]MBZ9674082.1 hypothetical protein [Mesorhizobium sp. ES1-3]